MFVLLTADAFLDKLADLVFHVRELVMSFNEFYGPCNAWVSVQWVVVMTAYDLLFQFLGNLTRNLLILLDCYDIVKLLRWSDCSVAINS